MRVDFEVILERLSKAGAKAAKLRERIAKIADLEEYTLLLPPFETDWVKKLILAAQNPEMLAFKFPAAYVNFMQCCDGGWLFENQIFSLDDEEDEDNDLITVNMYYRDENMLPEGTVCIGRTNYGAFIVIKPDGSMGLWELDEGYIANFDDLYAWLDDVLAEADYLLKEGVLTPIEDLDEDDEDEDEEEDNG